MRDFLGIDVEQLQEDAIQEYENVTGETLYAGDERRILINTLAGLASIALGHYNMLFNQNFPQYATGEYLDNIGASWMMERMPEQYAIVTLQYMLSAPQGSDVTVPAGMRSTPDGIHFFATTEDLVIPAGQTTGTVTAQATETGSAHNGFAAGTIINQVDLVPFVGAVSNIDESQGGAEIEDDESYRLRMQLALTGYSTAGSELGYMFWARMADSTIMDVAVTSPDAGQVLVTLLMDGGEAPSPLVIARVAAVLTSHEVRPLTDQVTVQGPIERAYSIDVDYYIGSDDYARAAEIQAAVEAAVEEYIAWQGGALGRHINPDVLVQKMLNAGASRVVVTSPTFDELDPGDLAVISGTPAVSFEGLL